MLDFILIGAAKCGTRSVADFLSQSKDVNFSIQKEPKTLYKYDDIDLIKKEYKQLFKERVGIKGEGTTGYSEPIVINRTIENIKKFEKTPKFIFIVRNPTKRIESALMQRAKKMKVKNHDELLSEKLTLYTRCMYGLVVFKYIEAFGRENLLVLNFDDLRDNKEKFVSELRSFLNIKDLDMDYLDHKNQSIGARRIPLINTIWKKHISTIYAKYNLPSLKSVAELTIQIFGKKIKKEEKFFLSPSQQETVNDILRADALHFKEQIGWNYLDLKY